MYSIEYFKTKHSKPEIEEPTYNSESKMYNSRMRRRYLHQKDLIDKCWNIKSITIDLEDIKHVIYDDNCRHLIALYASVGRINTSNISAITILNNNFVNKLFLYEILSCDWMINKDESHSNYEDVIIEKIEELHELISLYEHSKNNNIKIKLKKKIELFKYYINSIQSITKETKHDGKILKLGTHFKRTK